MFLFTKRNRPSTGCRMIKDGIVVTPPMSSEFWQRVLKGQFIWCEGWLMLALLCVLAGAFLELKGLRWDTQWSVNLLGFVLKNATPGLMLIVLGLWAAKRAEFTVKQESPPSPPPIPPAPPPQKGNGSWMCKILRSLWRIVFPKRTATSGLITWGRQGVVVPTEAVDKQFWEQAEKYQWWFSVTGLTGGFLCELIGVFTVWLSDLATPAWHASLAGVEIDNAPVGALLFLVGIALQEFTHYEVQQGITDSAARSK